MEKFLREPLYEQLSIRETFKKVYGVGKAKNKIAIVCLGLPANRSNYTFKKLGRISVRRIATFLDKTRWDIGEHMINVIQEDRAILAKKKILRQVRYSMGLPCHGQRTKSNAGTCKCRNSATKTFARFNKRQAARQKRQLVSRPN